MSGLPTFFRKLFSSYGNDPRIKESVTLPSQTGNSGKALVTNGTQTSWSDIDALPSQTGNGGKYLTTDGTNASWSDSLDYRHVSNCITKIPQDIKLELSSGALTLKAGSKVYVPNGFEADGTTPKFDVVTVQSDVQNTSASVSSFVSGNYTHVYDPQQNNFRCGGIELNQVQSGSTYDPTGTGGYILFYDTTNNVVKYTADAGSTWVTGLSLPFGIPTIANGIGYTSLGLVCNGFGYIGSTIYALPNVKGLIPNGRNADGSMKSTPFTVYSVLTHTFIDDPSTTRIALREGTISWHDFTYDRESNTLDISGWMDAGTVVVASRRVTSITPKHAHGNGTLVETYQNGTSWYRLWSDGWIEQGGKFNHPSSSQVVSVSFIKEFSDTNFTLIRTSCSKDGEGDYASFVTGYKTTSTSGATFFAVKNSHSPNSDWYACGY